MIEAIAQTLIEAGLSSKLAYQRGEDAVITIQGALILARGTNHSGFKERSAQLPDRLCAEV